MKTTVTILGTLILLALLLNACSKEPDKIAETPVRFAETVLIGTLGGEQVNIYSGDIRARHELVLSFRVGGKLIERKVESGDHIASGQLLARIDPSDTTLQQSAADAQFRLAADELKRFGTLREQNFVSQSALDAKENAVKVAAAQAGLAKNQVAYTNLRSEQSGIVYALMAEVGQDVTAGQPILRLAQDGEREVSIAIPESRISDIKVGMSAQIEIGEKTVTGRIREITPAADSASRTYPVRIAFDANKVETTLGMTARVRIGESIKQMGESSGIYRIPLSAVYQQGDKDAVWVVAADGSVSLRPVSVLGYRDNGALIKNGLVAGERIVSAGVHKLTAGDKIQIVKSKYSGSGNTK